MQIPDFVYLLYILSFLDHNGSIVNHKRLGRKRDMPDRLHHVIEGGGACELSSVSKNQKQCARFKT